MKRGEIERESKETENQTLKMNILANTKRVQRQ